MGLRPVLQKETLSDPSYEKKVSPTRPRRKTSSSPNLRRATHRARVEDPCDKRKRSPTRPTSRVARAETQPTSLFHAKLTKLDSIPTPMGIFES